MNYKKKMDNIINELIESLNNINKIYENITSIINIYHEPVIKFLRNKEELINQKLTKTHSTLTFLFYSNCCILFILFINFIFLVFILLRSRNKKNNNSYSYLLINE